MGTVWRAIQLSTKRTVALKILQRPGRASPRAQGRFEREVELAAGLDHPGIARIYDSGIDRGLYYYAMECVEGETLDAFVRRHGLSTTDIVRLVGRVCDAMQYAHQRGIIHRDLKPANILVTADGQPKILDFGLAKGLISDSHHDDVSLAGDIIGTVHYMAPEQARGEIGTLDTRTDVYSLGVILFWLLAGRFPHEAQASLVGTLLQIQTADPPRLRTIRADLDAELEAVILKALARDMDERYSSAGGLADDLRRYLNGDVVLARPQTALYFIRKRLVRYRFRVALVSIVALALVAAAVFYVQSIRTARVRAEKALAMAEQQRQIAEQNEMSANEQRALALTSLKKLVFTVQRELSSNLVQTDLQERLLDIAADGISHIASDTDFAELRIGRLASGAAVIAGDIRKAQGRPRDAIALYRRAVAQLSDGLRDVPEDGESAHDLLVAHTRLAQSLVEEGALGEAREQLQKARVLLDRLERGRAAKLCNVADRVALLWVAGDVAAATGDRRAAIGGYQQAFHASDDGAGEKDTRRIRAQAAHRLASAALVTTGSADASLMAVAEQAAREAASINERLVIESPQNLRSRCDLARALRLLAEVQRVTRNLQSARTSAQRGMDLLITIRQLLADRVDIRCEIAATALVLSDTCRDLGDTDAAEQALVEGLAAMKGLPATGKYVPELLASLDERLKRLQSTSRPR